MVGERERKTISHSLALYSVGPLPEYAAECGPFDFSNDQTNFLVNRQAKLFRWKGLDSG